MPIKRLTAVCTLTLAALATITAPGLADRQAPQPGGELHIIAPDGTTSVTCPLRHTEVQADIAGFVARVRVRQVFYNPLDYKIEAIYTFPLPEHAAVDDMTMTVGDRHVVGQIKPRGEARQIYDAAKAAGHVTGLLDQERPNIFTQSVANIEPGVEVIIEISYVETIRYDAGDFEFVFPMVVGPRYIPGGGSAPAPGTKGSATPQVPDGRRITPPVTPPGTRAGHDIDLTVRLDAGAELVSLNSILHNVTTQRDGTSRAVIQLTNKATIPNRDFVLRYRTGKQDIGDAFFIHQDERGAFFTLQLQPPRRVTPAAVVPRELIFVLDTSGSMRGAPIEAAKSVMSRSIDAMRANDTFNLITFAGTTSILWDKPRPSTPENRKAAQDFLASLKGRGGTEMMKAIETALVKQNRSIEKPLKPSDLMNIPNDGRTVRVSLEPGADPEPMIRDANEKEPRRLSAWIKASGRRLGLPGDMTPIAIGRWTLENGQRVLIVDQWATTGGETVEPIRIVMFMTDGYVGNDMDLINAVKKNIATTRVFSFGVGNSVNRFLLDGMAKAGRGEVEYVTLGSDPTKTVKRFCERISAPVLTDIEIDWGNLSISDVHPTHIPDLFSVKPIMIHGRINGPQSGAITLKGNTGSGSFARSIHVAPSQEKHDALASLWARAKVEDLMMENYAGLQRGNPPEELKNRITSIGVEYRLMTQFTSFVAVEQMTVTSGGESVTIDVPVEMPDGVSYEGVFGGGQAGGNLAIASKQMVFPASKRGRWSTQIQSAMPASSGVVQTHSAVPARRERGKSAPGVSGAMRRVTTEMATDEIRLDQQAQSPKTKLSEALRDLAKRVETEGKDGHLKNDKLRVTAYKIDVRVYLNNAGEETLKKLKDLGFTIKAESKSIKMYIGSIDVRKLEELAKLEAVIRVTALTE